MTTTHSQESSTDILHPAPAMLAMLNNQDALNAKISEVWREQGYPFLDAIMVEAVELFDHTEWKWWKKPSPINTNQVALEIIDIWHFVMSVILESHRIADIPGVSYSVEELLRKSITAATEQHEVWDLTYIRGHCQSLIAFAADPTSSPMYSENLPSWAPLVYSVGTLAGLAGMSYEQLYKLYLGKSVLNELRWEKGYGGDYIKSWFGKEDNDCMMEIASSNQAPDDVELYKAWLKSELWSKYTQVEMGITG